MKSTSPPFALLRAGITASFAALALLVSTFHVQAAYRPPDMEKKIFNTKDVKLGKFDRAGLVGALVSIARDFDKKEHDVELDTRSYALAIAGRLDKDNKKVKDTLEQLKSNGKSVGEDGVEKKRIAGRLYSGIRALIRKKDNKANQTCAAYCVSIALLFDPEGEKSDKLKEMKKDLEKAGFKASWKGLLKAAIRHNNSPFGGEEQKFEEVERPMPGGDATKFAKKQTRINGLVIRKLSSGRHMGAASSIMFTALRSEDTEGLLFKFDQKVGTMMAGSIEEVIKLMRVRYEDTDKVPSGYKIDIVFEDKYTLVDGPSAGTAFALAVDSLFSGEELDDKYACTGAITADGQTGPIGGVASKIRGAKNKGCTLVGIPVSNAKGVADYMLLNGIDQVLSIQVFTQKNFDEAQAIAKKNKSDDMKFAIGEFNKIAELVKGKKELIKNAKVKEKLEAILEKVPNHLSAKLLLQYANGNAPKYLSARGSLDEIDTECTGIFRAASILRYRGEGKSSISKEDAKESHENLEKLKEIMDDRFNPYYKEALKLCAAFKEGRGEDESDKDFAKKIGSIMEGVQKARQKLLGDPKVMEEING